MLNDKVAEFEKAARAILPRAHYDYFAGGADREITLGLNVDAFHRLQFRPRVLRDNVALNIGTCLLGAKYDLPILIAPTAFHQLVHSAGECATARAAEACGALMIISMAATVAVEEITASASYHKDRGGFWFQLYIQPDRGFTQSIVQRAEEAGCKALVITVDSPVFGNRSRDHYHGFNDLPAGMQCKHLIDDSGTQRKIEFDASLCWQDIDWLRSVSQLPIVLKGICHPEDALLAMQHGVSAIIVSNHGGRQLDGVAASVDLLPAIAERVNHDIPILVDGGIRNGADVVKALALGASAVGIGRPILWALAVNGTEGVIECFDYFKATMLHTLNLCGCPSIDMLAADLIVDSRRQ